MNDVLSVLLSVAIVEELELIWVCCRWRIDLFLFSRVCWRKHGVDGQLKKGVFSLVLCSVICIFRIIYIINNNCNFNLICRYSLPVNLTLLQCRGGAVGWGTVLQAGRSRVRFPTVSLDFFIDIILPAALWLWGQPLTEMNTRDVSWG